MAKRYFWLRLQHDFFDSIRIKKLRKLAGGDTYTIIYLKMQLMSLKTEGILGYKGYENSFAEELALDIDEDVENVVATLAYLERVGLLETSDNIEYFLPFVADNIGSEDAGTQRVREYRKRQKALHCNTDVTDVKRIGNVEKDIEIDIEKSREDIEKNITASDDSSASKPKKHKYGEYNHVLLTDAEHEKLENEFGLDMTTACITYLDEYIEMKGYKAKSHYLAIRKWVLDAVHKHGKKKTQREESAQDEFRGNVRTKEYYKERFGFDLDSIDPDEPLPFVQ